MRICLITSLLFLLACAEEKKEPDYVWKEDRFLEVLTEFQKAEAIVRLGYHRSTDSLFLNDSVYSAVFRKMNVSKAAFDSNYSYYLNDPERLERIYEQLIINLSTESAELRGKPKDSLQ